MAQVQQIKLWELAGEDLQIIISPFAWRLRLVLAYQGAVIRINPVATHGEGCHRTL